MSELEVNLYKLTHSMRVCYDSMIVAAHTASEAIQISIRHSRSPRAWPQFEEYIQANLIGTAAQDVMPGVILASFNG